MLLDAEIEAQIKFKVKEIGRNQFEIHLGENYYFQSYDTIIAMRDYEGNVYLDNHMWDCSRKTGTFRNIWLDETINETRKKIKSGEYKLVNLNK